MCPSLDAWKTLTTSFALAALAATPSLMAEVPSASYLFPAGGQQGTTVDFKVGGCYLHGEASFEMLGPGVEADPRVREVETVWFEGPLIPMPASQQKEDYPRDHTGRVTIAADAPAGIRHCRVWTSQGATPASTFVIGRLPEVVEAEIDGAPIPTEVSLPITINGRIFPREDVDVWTLTAKAGEIISCSVNAQRLGSALNARLEVRDPQGGRLAEAIAITGEDPSLQWQAPVDGIYAVRIHDTDFGGLQHYVYRLTITRTPHIESTYPLGGQRGTATRVELLGKDGTPRGEITIDLPADAPDFFPLPTGAIPEQADSVFLQTGDVPERLEAEPNDSPEQSQAAAAESGATSVPCVLNGRIQKPGDLDYWSVTAAMGDVIECELMAGDLGSPLFPVMTVYDPEGKEIGRSSNPGEPKTGANVRIEASAAGNYQIRIAEYFDRRGGAQFGYRLFLRPPSKPDFKLTLSSDAVTVFREVDGLTEEEKKERPPIPAATLAVRVQRLGGFDGEVELHADGLPEGLHFESKVNAKDKNTLDLTFRAEPGVKIQACHMKISGKAVVDGKELVHAAGLATSRGEPSLQEVLLAVAMPTPFMFTGEYNSYIMPRGSIYRRHYQLRRGGFTGPLKVCLADRQIRHLQGNRGPVITIPPEATEFEYGTVMAPRLEIGRTSRTMIMIYGTIVDHDGSEHIVSYTSSESKHQFIGQMVAGLLSISPLEPTLSAAPGSSVELPVVVGRQQALNDAAVQVNLSVPSHFQGIRADPVTVPAGQSSATLKIHFDGTVGAFNMPAKVTATTLDREDAHVAEAPLEFVAVAPQRGVANSGDLSTP